jgi:hypothetical protein
METVIWIGQAPLVAIFVITGLKKLTQPCAKVAGSAAAPLCCAGERHGDFR